MATYKKGQLLLKSDSNTNVHAVVHSLLHIFKKSAIDYHQAIGWQKGKEELENGIEIALSKLKISPPRMSLQNFIFQGYGRLGYGSSGNTWMAKGMIGISCHTKRVAIKQRKVTLDDISSIWKERDLLIFLKHPRICNIVGAFYCIDAFFIMDLCCGSVSRFLKEISKHDAIRFARHLLQAVCWMHSNNIIHTNITPESCLITQKNDLVLSEFDRAIILKHDKDEINIDNYQKNPGYLNLNANEKNLYSKQTDVFSAACVIFELDQNDFLLFCPNKLQTSEFYVDIIKNGRVIDRPYGFLDLYSKTKRESLPQRASRSRFSTLLNKMISNKQPISAIEALWSDDLELESIRDQDDKSESEMERPIVNYSVRREYDVDTKKEFVLLGNESDYGMNLAFVTFYYDQEDGEDDDNFEKFFGLDESDHE